MENEEHIQKFLDEVANVKGEDGKNSIYLVHTEIFLKFLWEKRLNKNTSDTSSQTNSG